MKIGEIWVTKQNIDNEFCKIIISARRSPELWIIEVLDCSRTWQDWFYLLGHAEEAGDLKDVRTMKFLMQRSDITSTFTKSH